MKSRLTQDIVNEAADALYIASGQRPSNNDVLLRIGFGSNTTICRMMRAWRENNSSPLSSLLPLPDRLIREIQQSQMDASRELRERYERELQNLQMSELTLLESNEAHESEIFDLQSEIRHRDQEIFATQKQLEQADSRTSSLQRLLAEERERSEALRLELAKNALQHEHSLQLKSELLECRMLLEQTRKGEADAQLRAAVALERVAGFERSLALPQ